MKQPTQATCAAVDERDQYRCARCGSSIDGGSRHHRKLRRHGDHSAANLVLLCGSGTTGCHGWVHSHPALAYLQGWMVHSWDAPAAVPMRVVDALEGIVWATHDEEGRRLTMTHQQAVDRLQELGLEA